MGTASSSAAAGGAAVPPDRRSSSSHLHRAEAAQAARAASCRRSLTAQVEYAFLRRPQPYAAVFLLSCVVVVLLVVTTTAVERIDVPFAETLAAVKATCEAFEVEVAEEEGKSGIDGDGEGGEGSSLMVMSEMVKNFGSEVTLHENSAATDPISEVFAAVNDLLFASSSGGAAAAKASSSSRKSTAAVLPTLPWPLPRHHNILFNVLALTDPYHHPSPNNQSDNNHSGGVGEGEEAEGRYQQSARNETDDCGGGQCNSGKKKKDADDTDAVGTSLHLLEAAFEVADAIDTVITKVKGRLSDAVAAAAAAAAATASGLPSTSVSSPIVLRHRVEIATIRRSAFADAESQQSSQSQQTSSSSSSTSSPLAVAARVATAYELPRRQRAALPPTDGHASRDAQVTFVVREKPSEGGPSEGPIITGAATVVGCTHTIRDGGGAASASSEDEANDNVHIVCLVDVTPTSNTTANNNNAATTESVVTNSLFVDSSALAMAVGTAAARAVGAPNFRADALKRWLRRREVASCARSFVYLKHVMEVLATHQRAAFPEELRPLWGRFTRHFFFASDGESSSTTSAFPSPNRRRGPTQYGAAAAVIHQALSHPSLIPAQTFPFDQLVVMYAPLLLPFIGALMQSVITIVKSRKLERSALRAAARRDAEESAAIAAAEAERA